MGIKKPQKPNFCGINCVHSTLISIDGDIAQAKHKRLLIFVSIHVHVCTKKLGNFLRSSPIGGDGGIRTPGTGKYN